MKKLIFKLSLLACVFSLAFEASARYRGDLNGDDKVDLGDMVLLAIAIQSGSTDKSLDVNASGKVDDYDLHKLADIIISGNLSEESGMNVGIGGWEDAGEDFGGTVKAPAFETRSAEDTRFYMRNPKSEGDDRCSMEFGIAEGNVTPCAIFFNIKLPRELQFDKSKMVELENSILENHAIYGSPKFKKENEDEEWSDYTLRFIVLSPDLKPLQEEKGKLGNIYFTPGDCWGSPIFSNCQIAMPNSNGCTYIEEHWADYNGNFKPIEVSSIWFDDSELTLTIGDEVLLNVNIEPWDASDTTINWSSSDESIAIVDENGKVTAVGIGKATIIASSGNVSAECIVNCYPQLGDVNGDGRVTVGDVVSMVNSIVGTKPSFFIDEVADVNGDGKITVGDVVNIVNTIINSNN